MWAKDIFQRRPLALILIALGFVFLLLGLTTGIDLPGLKHVVVVQGARWFALVLGGVLLAGGLASFLWTAPAAEGKDRSLSGSAQDTRRGLESVRIEHYLSMREAWDPLMEALGHAERRIILAGISHLSYLNRDVFGDAIKKFLLRPDAKLDVYFLDPKSNAITERARAEEADSETFRADVAAGVQRVLDQFWKAHQTKVRLFYNDVYPVWRIEKVDEDLIFAHSYPPGARGFEGAVLRLGRVSGNSSLFAAFDSILDRLESVSKPVPEAPAP